MIETHDTVIGGLDIEIEVDETKIGKRKNNRGHRVEGAWVVAGIERTTERRVFAEVVQDRTADTIESVIMRHVASGSVLLTDEWRAYGEVARRLRLQHKTVCHKHGFAMNLRVFTRTP